MARPLRIKAEPNTRGIQKESQAETIRAKTMFLQDFAKFRGNVGKALKRCGKSRQTYYDWTSDDQKFKQQLVEIKEGLLDIAEDCLKNAIAQGDTDAAKWMLKHLARDRGYGDHIQIDANINITAAEIIRQAQTINAEEVIQ